MSDDTMGPDRRGYITVFVGGKYGRWRRVENLGDDTIRLEPIGPSNRDSVSLGDSGEQLSIADDPNYSTINLGDLP